MDFFYLVVSDTNDICCNCSCLTSSTTTTTTINIQIQLEQANTQSYMYIDLCKKMFRESFKNIGLCN